MPQTSGILRTSPSGEEIVGQNDGDTLVWHSDSETWVAEPGGGGGGAVDSVFGRTGDVVAEPGDYAQSGDNNGYLARYVYVNPADPDVGQPNNEGNILLAAETWTTPDDIPPGNLFEVVCWSAGGAGANGIQVLTADPTTVTGPAAAGGGARIVRWFSRRDLIAALPIAMTVALRSEPAPLATTAHQVSLGETGGPTFFGNLVTAYGGGPGRSRDNAVQSGGSGGGSRGPGLSGLNGAASRGGYPSRTTTSTAEQGLSEGGAGTLVGANDGLFAAYGGGASGAGSASSGTNPGRPGGCAESGGGGGGSPGTSSASASGRGGRSGPSTTPDTLTGGGGIAGTDPSPNGGAGADGTHYNSGDGGGAGFSRLVDDSVQGGSGGDGGNPAGGGGAGGSGRGPNGTAWAGQGGRGGRGQITVTAYG